MKPVERISLLSEEKIISPFEIKDFRKKWMPIKMRCFYFYKWWEIPLKKFQFMFMWPITVLYFAFTAHWSQQYLFYFNCIFISYLNLTVGHCTVKSVAVDEVANVGFSGKDNTKHKMILLLLKPQKPKNYLVSEFKTDWSEKRNNRMLFSHIMCPMFDFISF